MGLLERFRPLKADTSTSDEIGAELGRLDKVKADAERELSRLGDMRPGLLVTASNDELATHDAAMTRCRRDIERADARRAVLEPEWRARESLDAEQRDVAERADLYTKARAGRKEGVRLIDEYQRDAEALAGKLRRLSDIERTIRHANSRLPDGKAEIEAVEAFNGRAATRDHTPEIETWVDPVTGANYGAGTVNRFVSPHLIRKRIKGYAAIPGLPAIPHRSFLDRVSLPAAGFREAAYWQGSDAAGPALTDPQVAGLRMNGLIP